MMNNLSVVPFRGLATIILILLSLFFSEKVEAQANPSPFDFLKKTIVVDPGHGGRDTGATGPEGTLEKTVTSVLARMIAAELKKKEYQVVLTRTGDYLVDITERTGIANNSKAHLFVSLHTSGSFLRTINEPSVFYRKIQNHPTASADSTQAPLSQNSTAAPWSTLQKPHQLQSRKLAEIIKIKLVEKSGMPVQVYEAPILVLEGADMPAILLEIGYLTNPAQEKAFNNKDMLYELAKQISSGIHAFLTE